MVKLDIVSGFLGAGKTTFIRKLVSEVYMDEKVVILENEFGEVSLDGMRLEGDGIRVESLIAGCICCSMAGSLVPNLVRMIYEYQPDRIIIEPTGIAKLSDLTSAIMNSALQRMTSIERIITIIDARNFRKRQRISKVFFDNQIKSSPVAFLSKLDGLGEDEIRERVEDILRINPACHVIDLPWDQMSSQQLIAFMDRPAKDIERMKPSVTKHYDNNFSSISGKFSRPVSDEDIRTFVSRLTNGNMGDILRIKGNCSDAADSGQLKTFDYVPDDLSFDNVTLQAPLSDSPAVYQVCIIGTDLDTEGLQALIQNI